MKSADVPLQGRVDSIAAPSEAGLSA